MLQLAQYGTEKFSNKIRIEIIDITNWTILLVSLDKTFQTGYQMLSICRNEHGSSGLGCLKRDL